jgi:archaellum component FlaC
VVASSEFYSDIQDELTQVRTDFENADDALNDAKLNK